MTKNYKTIKLYTIEFDIYMTDIAIKQNRQKKPPAATIKSPQFDLFSQFLSNDDSGISNTVEMWERIPKYFFTPKQVEKLRTADGLANPHTWSYRFNGLPCTVKIQPALIEQDDGTYKAFFPGATEEFVEEALKKIFTDQQYGIHDPGNLESWVRFSLSMIRKELKARKRSRDRNQIKHAIEVMSSCILTVAAEGKEVWKGSILQDLVTVGRKEYLADREAHHIARLPLFISRSINRLEYRQFNYDRLMVCDEQLARWVYKQLIHRYRQASLSNTYHFMLSELEDSGLLQQSTAERNRTKAKSAMNELVQNKILLSYKAEPRREGRKITDVKYTVVPSPEFVAEQKASNKRAKDWEMSALQQGLSVS